MPVSTEVFLPTLYLKPKSILNSCQLVAIKSIAIVGASIGFFVIMFINPPTASLP